ncbi:hypothetical protein ACWDR9_10920 [Streptosporangium sandarakinum]
MGGKADAGWTAPLGQIAGVWLVGSLLGPLLLEAGAMVLFGGHPLLLALPAALMVGTLYLVARLTPRGSALTSRQAGGRLSWSALVLLVGAAGWAGGAWATSDLDLPFGRQPLMTLACGLPFALAAGLFSRRAVSLGAVVVIVALVATGTHLADRQRADGEEKAIAARPDPVRDLLYVVDIPGYRVARDSSGVSAFFEPVDQKVVRVWQDHAISLTAERGEPATATCPKTFLSAPLGRDERPRCVLERPGLWYLTGRIPEPKWGCPCGLRGYVRQDSGVLVSVLSSDAVSRDVLRAAVLGARRPTGDEARRLVRPS